jgi:hypothetical protein
MNLGDMHVAPVELFDAANQNQITSERITDASEVAMATFPCLQLKEGSISSCGGDVVQEAPVRVPPMPTARFRTTASIIAAERSGGALLRRSVEMTASSMSDAERRRDNSGYSAEAHSWNTRRPMNDALLSDAFSPLGDELPSMIDSDETIHHRPMRSRYTTLSD